MKRILRVLVLFGVASPATVFADSQLVYTNAIAVAPSPRALPARPVPPPSDTVVRICFTDDPMIAEGCRALVRYQRMCGLKVVVLENPTLDEIRHKLKGLPPNTNVSISSHGSVLPSDRPAPAGRHHLTVDRRLTTPSSPPASGRIPIFRFPEVPLDLVGIPYSIQIPPIRGVVGLLPTRELLQTIDKTLGRDGVIPGKHLAACHSGAACDDGQVRLVGASCRGTECSWGYDESIEDQERVLAYLACSPKAFAEADTNRSGALEATEITEYFASRKLPRQLDGRTQTPQWNDLVIYATKPNAPAGWLARAVHTSATHALQPPKP